MIKSLIVGLCFSLISIPTDHAYLTRVETALTQVIETVVNETQTLLRITEAEATDGTVTQKKNVIACIMNRVNSPQFPDTIRGVVFQPGQFSPLSDGRYYKVTISTSTRQAYKEYLAESNHHSCLFFCMPTCESYRTGWFSTLKESFQDGMHAYFTGERK